MKDIEKIYEKYSILSNGFIMNKKTKNFLKKHIDKYGYERVNLHINGKNTQRQVHRLIAFTHVDNPENKPQVNHKDSNKQNNNASNLEWVTNQENRTHAVNNRLHKHFIYEFYKDGNLIFTGGSTDACEKLGLDQSAISSCVNGKQKTTKGYKIIKL